LPFQPWKIAPDWSTATRNIDSGEDEIVRYQTMSKPEEQAVEAVSIEQTRPETTVVSDDVQAKTVYNVSHVCKIYKEATN
jgi:hypothetical protein